MRLNRLPQRRDPAHDSDPREHQGAEIIDLATRNVLPRVTQQKPGGDGIGMAAGLVFVALLGGVTLWSMNAGRLEKSQTGSLTAPSAAPQAQLVDQAPAVPPQAITPPSGSPAAPPQPTAPPPPLPLPHALPLMVSLIYHLHRPHHLHYLQYLHYLHYLLQRQPVFFVMYFVLMVSLMYHLHRLHHLHHLHYLLRER